MSPSPSVSSRKEEIQLVQRLTDRDPTAPADLIAAYLEDLFGWLQQVCPYATEHQCQEAAEDTLLRLIKAPDKYDPEKLSLFPYLRMCAHKDLINILAKEQRYRKKYFHWNSVENSEEDGKYLGIEDDPAFGLLVEEIENGQEGSTIATMLSNLDAREREVFDLMRIGEHRTKVYADVLGLGNVSSEKQAREVKRIKDRIKKRIARAGIKL